MSRILVFGASGHIGSAIAERLIGENQKGVAIVRSPHQLERYKNKNVSSLLLPEFHPESLSELIQQQDIIISALGKSVGLSDKSKSSFLDIDFKLNQLLIQISEKKRIKKFIYVSAYGAAEFKQLNYFRAHYLVEQRLMNSTLDYAIVAPVAVFSSFLELIPLARRGLLFMPGQGLARTNPIHEKEVAEQVLHAISSPIRYMCIGGKTVYSRRQLFEIVQQNADPGKRVKSIPIWLIRSFLPFLKLMNPALYDKLAFYLHVSDKEILAYKTGSFIFEDYLPKDS